MMLDVYGLMGEPVMAVPTDAEYELFDYDPNSDQDDKKKGNRQNKDKADKKDDQQRDNNDHKKNDRKQKVKN